eukprot:jgi/Chrzof1/2018/UNPLg00673.t1
MSVANKRAYAATRNYTLYVSSVKLQHAKSMVWDKFIIIKAVMQHSCAEWVWMLDADAFIMNLDIDLKKVITAAVEQHNSTTLPDVIIAKDCNGMNAGSFLVRNTLWTWQHLSDAWAANNASEIDRFEGWQEQAALSHMVRNISGVADHYAFAPQLSINAYSAATGCNVERPYQKGDFVLHFVDRMKQGITLASGWLNEIPIDTADMPDAAVFSVWPSIHTSQRCKSVLVSMNGTLGSSKSSFWERYCVMREPHYIVNLGWPVPAPAFIHKTAVAYLRLQASKRTQD